MLTKSLKQVRRIELEQGHISDGVEMDDYADEPEEDQEIMATGALEEADVAEMLHMARLDTTFDNLVSV